MCKTCKNFKPLNFVVKIWIPAKIAKTHVHQICEKILHCLNITK